MATYFFETITAACAISFAAPLNYAPEGAGGGSGGAGESDGGAAGEPAATVSEDATKTAPPAAAVPAVNKGKVKHITATVRRGTVVVGDHGSEEHVGPGGQVTLPEADVIALRASGVLHDPESAPMVPAGPTVDNDTVEPKVTTPKAKAAARKR